MIHTIDTKVLNNMSQSFFALIKLFNVTLWEFFTPALVDSLSESDRKSTQVPGTLVSIMVDPNNAVVLIYWACPLISKSSSPFAKILGTYPSAPIKIGIIVTIMFHNVFSSQARSTYLVFFPLKKNHCIVHRDGKKKTEIPEEWISIRQFLYFSVNNIKVRSSGQDLVICLHPKILDSFEHFILQERIWLVPIPFVRMVNFKLFAQFFVDHLQHPVLYSFTLFLFS